MKTRLRNATLWFASGIVAGLGMTVIAFADPKGWAAWRVGLATFVPFAVVSFLALMEPLGDD